MDSPEDFASLAINGLPEKAGFVSYATNNGIEYRPILTGDDARKTFDSIPVIDASYITSPDLEVRKKLAEEIADAAANVGFFYLENPPIDTKVMDEAFAATQKFFDLPLPSKEKISIYNSRNAKGYDAGYGGRSEAFKMGNDPADPEQHYIKNAPISTSNLNQWPDDDMPEFRTAIYEYYRQVRAFSDKLVGRFALALGLEENGLDHLFKYPLTEFTIQHYFKHEIGTSKPTLGAHTDYGAFTCLLQHEIGGLEVLNANAIWIPAPVREHTFVINTGTYFEIISNGRWPSTVHRVCSKGDAERMSIPFFYSFDPSVTIRPLQLLRNEQPNYGEKNIGYEHLKGLVLSHPEHPFIKQLRSDKFEENGYTYEKLLQGQTEIAVPS